MPFHTTIRTEQIPNVVLHGLGMNTTPIPDYPELSRIELFLLPQKIGPESRPRAEWGLYETTDEGYNKVFTEVRYHAGKWYMERSREALDCDGPITFWDEWESDGGLEPGSRESQLKSISSRQRDVFAERMGY